MDVCIIDDAVHEYQPFLSRLAISEISAKAFSSIPQFVKFISNRPPIRMFIIDVMLGRSNAMPSHAMHGGLTSGILLALRVRRFYPSVPILFFTGASLEWIVQEIRAVVPRVRNCALLRKCAVKNVDDFTRLVESTIIAGGFTHDVDPIVHSLGDSVILRPSLSGIGIDLKLLWGWLKSRIVHRTRRKRHVIVDDMTVILRGITHELSSAIGVCSLCCDSLMRSDCGVKQKQLVSQLNDGLNSIAEAAKWIDILAMPAPDPAGKRPNHAQ